MKDENAPVEEQQAQSLEDSLSEAFDNLEASEEDVEEIEVEEEPEPEAVAEDEPAEVEDPEEDEPAEVTDYNEPAPERWPDEIKQVYNSLPPEAKKAMLEDVYKPMQRQYTKTTQEIAEERKKLGPMMEILNQHSKDFESAGVNPVEAFQRQMAWSAHFARVGQEQGMKDLAAAYGQDSGEEDIYMTPVEKAQQAEIDRLKGAFSTLSKSEQQRQEQAMQEANQQRSQVVRDSIARFKNEQRDGKPLHPHVEKLSTQMAGLINGGLVHRTDEYGQPVPYEQQLSQAYQLACKLDPSISSSMTTASRREQVAKVTRASRDVVSKEAGGADVIADTRPISETLEDIYDRLDRRASP